jgi:D-serine deaminase-like pyridoxal phosphate-dependent protein
VSVAPVKASPQVGRGVSEVDTPSAIVDLDRAAANIARAARHVAAHGLELHPHTKTHKTLELARMQLDAGATGLTVAKSSEALVFAELAPILVHYPVVGPEKVARLVDVAGATQLTVALDSLAAAEPLAAALATSGASAEVLLELDVGMGRTGLDPESALAVGRAIDALGGGLTVTGISCYPGHLHDADDSGIRAGLREVAGVLSEALALMADAGIGATRVSAGSTATLYATEGRPFTELRPGNYALLDRREVAAPFFSLADCALSVAATVVSTSVSGMVILDSGSKALSEAGPPPGEGGYGVVAGHPELEISVLSEEHAHCRIAAGETSSLTVGDRVRVIPNHACTCVNLHDSLYGARDGVIEVELPVATRGMVR